MTIRQRQPAALDVRSILQAAFDARDEVPDLWALWLAEAHGAEDGWHERPAAGEPWRHHASAITECLRRSVFDRMLIEREPSPIESEITYSVGHHIHALMQFGLSVHPEYKLLAHEFGGDFEFEGVILSTRADAVYEFEGRVGLIEIKSEKAWASTGRRKEAKAAGRTTFAKLAHMKQTVVQSIVLQGLELFKPEFAWVLYWEKNDGQLDQQPVDIYDPELVASVDSHLVERENAWSEYQMLGTLPPRLATFPDKGLCQPISETNPNGRYCPYRGECLK